MSLLKHDKLSKSSRPHAPAAFTLVELVVSLSITSILLVTIASSVVIASHAIPDGTEKSSVVIVSSRGLDQLVEELRYALAIREQTATSLEFTVADRNGDILQEVIRYAWTGVAGDPLTRQYNGGALIPVVENVQDFTLGYQTITYQKRDPPVESEELGIAGHGTGVVGVQYGIDESNTIGQFFMPSNLDPEAISWKVTRVFVEAKRRETNGETRLQFWVPTPDNLPGPTMYEQLILREADMQSSFFWEEYFLTNVGGIPADQGLCLVFEWVKADSSGTGSFSMYVGYDGDSGTGLLLSNNGGASWTNSGTNALYYAVFGIYVTLGPIVDAYALTRVDVSLVASGTGNVVLYASGPTFNTPEVLTP